MIQKSYKVSLSKYLFNKQHFVSMKNDNTRINFTNVMISLINIYSISVKLCKCGSMDCKSFLRNFAQSSLKIYKQRFTRTSKLV